MGVVMTVKRVAPAAALLVLLVACGGQAGQSYGSGSGSTAGSSQATQSGQSNGRGGAYGYGRGGGSTGSTGASTGSAGAAAAAGTISLAKTSLGQVLVGPDGRTLYFFDPDNQSASTCYDQCAAAWPPLEMNGKPSVGQGLDVSKLGQTQRKDGSMQVTYNKWPLYYFAKDSKPGDVNGEGVNGTWWVINASGDRVHK